jgi:hypothetical protein
MPVFKTGAINRSATSPVNTVLLQTLEHVAGPAEEFLNTAVTKVAQGFKQEFTDKFQNEFEHALRSSPLDYSAHGSRVGNPSISLRAVCATRSLRSVWIHQDLAGLARF